MVNSFLALTRVFFQFVLVLALASLFPILATALPDASKDGIDKVKTWSKSRLTKAEEEFSKSKGERFDSPKFWGEEIIYQIQVDRFNNGDIHNDDFNLSPVQIREIKSGHLFGIINYRHGGDLQGVIQRLDYLKDLGITSLWLTPIFKHSGSYHGYCSTDPTQVDPGFGTNEELQELVNKAHQRQIKVILDIVINHLCDSQTNYEKPADHYRCSNDLNANNWNGTPGGSPGQGKLKFSSQFFPPFKSQYFFNRCGANSPSDMEGTEPASVYGDFVAEMFDFDTRNYDLQEIFTELHKYWIAYADVDGFRLDAAKHVSEDFIAYFSTQTRDYARSIGKKNFLVVGEVAGPSDWIARRLGNMLSHPADPNQHGLVPQSLTNRLLAIKDIYNQNPVAPYPGMNAAFAFAQGGTAKEVLHGKRPSFALEAYFKSDDHLEVSRQSDYRLNWNLLEIHDWPRFASLSKKSPETSILGLAYLAFSEGTPVIYYGMEQGFNGDCHFDKMKVGNAAQEIQKICSEGHAHGLFRQDMFQGGYVRLGSSVEKIDQLAYIGLPDQGSLLLSDWRQDPYLDRSHPVYQASRRFFHLRKSCPALRYGQTQFRWVNYNSKGLLAFSRIDRVSSREILVLLNTDIHWMGIPEVTVNEKISNTIWVNMLNLNEQAVTNGRGRLSFGPLNIEPLGVKIFIPKEQVGTFNPEVGIPTCLQQ